MRAQPSDLMEGEKEEGWAGGLSQEVTAELSPGVGRGMQECSVISGVGWAQSSSQAPLPIHPFTVQPPPPQEKEKRLIRYGGPHAVVPNSAGSMDIKTGPSDAELTGMRPRPPLSIGPGGKGLPSPPLSASTTPGSLSPPSWLSPGSPQPKGLNKGFPKVSVLFP